MFCVLSISGNHHHLPVCCGCTAALHAVPATGRSSYSQTWPVYPATAQRGGFWGNYSKTCLFFFSWMWSPWIYFLCLFVFRRCVRKWTTARPRETQSWSGLREHSSAGKSRSRNNARLFLTATRCLVKLDRWPQTRFRVGNFPRLSALTRSPAALSLTSLSLLRTAPSELVFPHLEIFYSESC